jgi:hypothetical protein
MRLWMICVGLRGWLVGRFRLWDLDLRRLLRLRVGLSNLRLETRLGLVRYKTVVIYL